MSEKVSQKMRTYLVSTLIHSLKNLAPASWKAGAYYSVGSQVTSNGRIYIAVNTGNTSTIAPSHTSGVMTDGTVQWLYVSSAIGNTDVSSNLYLGLGKPTEWGDGDTPEIARTTSEKEREALDSLITLIRLNPTNIRMGLKKETWVSGRVFSAFDPTVDLSLYGSSLPSVYTTVETESRINIYKCIDNNGGAQSTDQPYGEQLGYFLMSDGYIWKFMGSVDPIDEVSFSTNDFYPVQTKYSNDGSEQWQVQEQARAGSVSSFGDFVSIGTFSSPPTATVIGVGSGATAGLEFNNPGEGVYDLTRVLCASAGENYTPETYAIISNSVDVEGSGATVELEVNDGQVSVSSFTGGSGYSNGAVVVIVGDGGGATASVVVSSGVVSVVEITDPGAGYTWAKAFVIPGDAGAVSRALMAPTGGHGRDLVTELGARTAIVSLQVGESLEPYVVDGEYRQISLVSSVQSKEIGKQNAATYIGPAHPDFNNPAAEQDKYKEGTGHLLFINNFDAVNHSSEQEEAIKIALTF